VVTTEDGINRRLIELLPGCILMQPGFFYLLPGTILTFGIGGPFRNAYISCPDFRYSEINDGTLEGAR
jgi:hypothetical protein